MFDSCRAVGRVNFYGGRTDRKQPTEKTRNGWSWFKGSIDPATMKNHPRLSYWFHFMGLCSKWPTKRSTLNSELFAIYPETAQWQCFTRTLTRRLIDSNPKSVFGLNETQSFTCHHFLATPRYDLQKSFEISTTLARYYLVMIELMQYWMTQSLFGCGRQQISYEGRYSYLCNSAAWNSRVKFKNY